MKFKLTLKYNDYSLCTQFNKNLVSCIKIN